MFLGTKKTVLIWQMNDSLQSKLSLETVSLVIRWIFYNHSGIKKYAQMVHMCPMNWHGWTSLCQCWRWGGIERRPEASRLHWVYTPPDAGVSQTDYTYVSQLYNLMCVCVYVTMNRALTDPISTRSCWWYKLCALFGWDCKVKSNTEWRH